MDTKVGCLGHSNRLLRIFGALLVITGLVLPNAQAAHVQRVGIYIDEGASYELLLPALRETVSADTQLIEIKAADIIERSVLDSLQVLVIPGGADLPYCAKLNGKGTHAIRTFVESGGIYLGICAGAYFACQAIYFKGNTPSDTVQGPRELAFFKGTAVGPLTPYKPGPAYTCLITLTWDQRGSVHTCYHGGPWFKLPQTTQVNPPYVFAWYSVPIRTSSGMRNHLPAALEVNVGKGKAILCGVHPEINASLLASALTQSPSHSSSQALLNHLRLHPSEQQTLFHDLLKRCHIPLRNPL